MMQATKQGTSRYRTLVGLVEEIRTLRGLVNVPQSGPHPEPSCEAFGEWHNLLWNLVVTAEGRWRMLGVSERPHDAEFVSEVIQQAEEELPRIRRFHPHNGR